MSQAVTNSSFRAARPATDARLEAHQRLMLWLVSKAGGLGVQGSGWARYGTAVAAVAIATLVRLLLDPILGDRAPYGLYLIATVFVVWRAGLGPALVAVGCGTLLARYLFESPRGSIALFTEPSQVSMGMSLAIGLITTVLCESLRVTALDNARLYQEARQADARKDQFLATLGHELRNPLVPIRNAVYLLETSHPQEARAAELNKLIAQQTEHLVRLVNDLLDVARITQGKIELRREQTQLQPIVDSAVQIVRSIIAEKQLELHVSLPDEPIGLFADGVRVTQIVANLLHNAAKYTDAGGRIWLTAEVDRWQLVVRVRDTGIGIPPGMCERIFEPFEQVNQAVERSQGGLGIGLTLVRTLVQLHGGTVEARSAGPDLGSEFTVRLPVVAVPHLERSRTAHDIAALPAIATAPLRIVVLDDSQAAAASLAGILRLWGHSVEISHDGFAALDLAKTFRPGVILADLGMPRMSGYEFAKEVRRLPELDHAILVALTGYGREADQQQSLAAGFSLHLIKPIDPAELMRVLATLEREG